MILEMFTIYRKANISILLSASTTFRWISTNFQWPSRRRKKMHQGRKSGYRYRLIERIENKIIRESLKKNKRNLKKSKSLKNYYDSPIWIVIWGNVFSYNCLLQLISLGTNVFKMNHKVRCENNDILQRFWSMESVWCLNCGSLQPFRFKRTVSAILIRTNCISISNEEVRSNMLVGGYIFNYFFRYFLPYCPFVFVPFSGTLYLWNGKSQQRWTANILRSLNLYTVCFVTELLYIISYDMN